MLASYNPAEIDPVHYQDLSHTVSSSPYQYDLDTLLAFYNNSLPPPPSSDISSNSSSPSIPRSQLMPIQQLQLQNPPIRVHNSSPLAPERSQSASQPMLAQAPYLGNAWGSSDNLLSPNIIAHTALPRRFNQERSHKRESSTASSVASAGPPSPQDSIAAYPHIAGSDVSSFSPSFDSLDFFATTTRGARMQKSLPTPVDTPTQNNFGSDFQHFPSPHDAHSTNSAMRRFQQDSRSQHDDDLVSYGFSGPQSVSSVSHHDSPATPQTAYEHDFEDGPKNLQHSSFNPQLNIPHSMPTVNFDDFYSNPQLQNVQSPQTQQQMVPRTSGLSPFRTSLANRFQAAQLDHVASRTSSPVTSVQREKSPFRNDSNFNAGMPMSPLTNQRLVPQQMSSTQYQQQNLSNAAMMAQHQQQQQQRQQQAPEQPKTVSPKDVELEYHEEDQTPLFPSSQASQYSLPREDSSYSTPTAYGQSNQYYATMPTNNQQSQQYSYMGQQARQQGGIRSAVEQSLPDFPAHLSSMETTVSSDSGHSPSTPVNASKAISVPRPRDTSADVGAYSCTNHGCNQRFESPAKLQKHRREAHRQLSPTASTSPLPSHSTANHGHTSSPAIIALRNSQAGPHKCERINPTTGKPCNSIFSRPYDLTRHEDTIHNARKQKVRCHLCTEEKTFSRNDALTRHMRVVHPDVDWPGKTKRKGRE